MKEYHSRKKSLVLLDPDVTHGESRSSRFTLEITKHRAMGVGYVDVC